MKARPLDAFAASLTFSLCVVWGFNQVVAKLALPDVGPIAQTGIRSAIGVACVATYALLTNRRVFELDGTEAAGTLAGVLFTADSLRFTNRCASPRRRGRPSSFTRRLSSSRSARRSC
jgi:drug/metabolite transporter (DMT)-like permease